MFLRCGFSSWAGPWYPLARGLHEWPVCGPNFSDHWTSGTVAELTNAHLSVQDARWCSQGPPSAILPGATDERRPQWTWFKPAKLLPWTRPPSGSSTALSACLAAGYLVRSISNFYISVLLYGMFGWINQVYSKDKSCVDMLSAKHLTASKPTQR